MFARNHHNPVRRICKDRDVSRKRTTIVDEIEVLTAQFCPLWRRGDVIRP